MLTAKQSSPEHARLKRYAAIAALFLLSSPLFSQPIKIYADLGMQYTRFSAETLSGVSDGRPGFNMRYGVSYVFGKENRLSVGAELGTYTRRMKRTVDDYHNINRFFTFEAPVFFNAALGEHWFVETGVAFLFSSAGQSALRDTEAATRIRLGRGFQRFDVAPFLGGGYRFSEHFSAGARARFGLLPMVEYQTVGDFGAINPPQTDLYSATFEVFLRISSF